MNRAKVSMVLASLLVAALWAAPSHAAEESLKQDQLYTMLSNMGFEVSKTDVKGGYEIYMKVTYTYDLNFRVGLSSDGSRIWLTQTLATFTPAQKARIPWQKLMAANCSQVTSSFRYFEDTGSLGISLSFENRGLTPALLRKHIEVFEQDIVYSADLWDTSKWDKQADSAATYKPGK
ncbi:MAG: hypothetical protein HY291_00560 [Planctomycetes bacterium]|nr:hypothetical protein [Planctomycetota bacterium]